MRMYNIVSTKTYYINEEKEIGREHEKSKKSAFHSVVVDPHRWHV